MKANTILIFIVLILTSCDSLLKVTLGKYYINRVYNGGCIEDENYCEAISYAEKNGGIYLLLKHQNKEYYFLFDTGAYSSISTKIIDEFKGEFTAIETSSTDINGVKQKHPVFCVEEFSLGKNRIQNMNFAVKDYSDENLDGIIGVDFLEGKVFRFDLAKDKLVISNSTGIIDNSKFKGFRLKRRWDKIYMLKVKMPNHKVKDFILDTGSDGFMKATTNSDFNPIVKKEMRVLIQGVHSIKEKSITYFKLEDFQFKNILIDTATVIVSADYNENLLGAHIFKNSSVILDCIHNKIYFENKSIESIGNEIPRGDVVFGWIKDSLKVVKLNIALDTLGIKTFDQVIKINQQAINGKTSEIQTFMHAQKSLPFWEVTFRRGNDTFNMKLSQKQLGFMP